MHKKLESELISLAHSILQMKNKDDVSALLEKASEIHEKLSVLAFVENYVNTTPNLDATKEELVAVVEQAFDTKESIEEEVESVLEVVQEEEIEEEVVEEEAVDEVAADEEPVEDKVVYNLEEEGEEVKEEEVPELTLEPAVEEEVIEQPFDELEELLFDSTVSENDFKEDVIDVGERKTASPNLEDELKDTVSVDITASLFDEMPQSLNDQLSKNIQIGLNDRIAFVKNLFDNSQEDYNRVISQLNSFNSQKEAKKFITKNVKPDYDWSSQEEVESRFMEFIERKFA